MSSRVLNCHWSLPHPTHPKVQQWLWRMYLSSPISLDVKNMWTSWEKHHISTTTSIKNRQGRTGQVQVVLLFLWFVVCTPSGNSSGLPFQPCRLTTLQQFWMNLKIKNAKLIQTACSLKKSTRPVTSPTCNSSSRCWEYSLGTVSPTCNSPKREVRRRPPHSSCSNWKKKVNPLPPLRGCGTTNQATGLMIGSLLLFLLHFQVLQAPRSVQVETGALFKKQQIVLLMWEFSTERHWIPLRYTLD